MNVPTDHDEPAKPGPAASPDTPAGIGLVALVASAAGLGVAVAGVDVAFAWLESRRTDWNLGDYADSAGLAAVAVAAAYLLLWFVSTPLRRNARLDAESLAAALGLSAIGFHTGLALVRLPHRWVPLTALWPAVVLGLLSGIAGFLVADLVRRRGLRPLGLVVAGLAAEIGIGVAFIGRPGGLSTAHLAIGLGLLALTTAGAVRSSERISRSGILRAASILALLMAAAHPVRTLLREPVDRPTPLGVEGPAPLTLLIVVDTLRADELSCYGATAHGTPAIDALAADSVVFDVARAPAGWTRPSVASILTGLSPLVHGSTSLTRRLPREVATLAEGLRAAGWRTGAFGENTALLPYSGLARGFERYELFPHYQANPPLGQLMMKAAWPDRVLRGLLAPDLNRFALRWLDAEPGRPSFAWLHYLDVHHPYTPSRAFYPTGESPGDDVHFGEVDSLRGGPVLGPDERSWLRSLYRGEIRQLDAEVGQLLAGLRERGRYDAATIIFTSDHGEEFWEHDGFEHGHTLYEELLRVPLIVKLPGSRDAQRVSEPVTIESITPTLLTLAGVETDPEAYSAPSLFEPDGSLAGNASPEVFLSDGSSRFEPPTAVIARGHKYVLWNESGIEELYDLTQDPGELDSLVETRPAVLAELRGIFKAELRMARQKAASLGIAEIDEELLDQHTTDELRRLGYVE